jgi:hypothetical protein
MCKFHNFYSNKAQVHFPLLLFGKLRRRRTLTGLAANSTHATVTAMHFPANAGLIFSYGQIDEQWVLGGHWGNIEYCTLHVQCQAIWPPA